MPKGAPSLLNKGQLLACKTSAQKLCRLFVHSKVNSKHVLDVLGHNKIYEKNADEIVAEFIEREDNGTFDGTLKNIILCCVLHCMLLDKHNDAANYKKFCEPITDVDYIPGSDECRACSASNIAVITSVLEEQRNILNQKKKSVTVLNLSELKKVINDPVSFGCAEFNEDLVVSPTTKTLWNFVCQRNHFMPILTHREEVIKAFRKLANNPKESALMIKVYLFQQLLFHTYS